jgi:hypothetical protein
VALKDVGEMNPATRSGLGWVFEPSVELKFP